MSRCLSLITVLLLSDCILGDIVISTITGVISGVEDGVAYIASSQCQNVKQILGVDYDQSEEPDMSKLTLDLYINDTTVVKYNLTEIMNTTLSEYLDLTSGLIIYFHGFTDDPSQDSFQTMNTAYRSQGYKNIMALDASGYIRFFYLQATTLVAYIGEAVARVLVILTEAGLPASKIHLVGHSLGSHIASFAAKTYYNLSGTKLGRISGLDPAGPCFSNLSSSYRLNETDATFVDVIHTDAGVYGLTDDCGQVDYRPNGGSDQPGCVLNTCSHSRAWEYYAESVNNTSGFQAVLCGNWTSFINGNCANNSVSYMGNSSEAGTAGDYYLRTGSSSPYALGSGGT